MESSHCASAGEHLASWSSRKLTSPRHQKTGGLIGAFQWPGAVGYLMNNCEDWHGLQRFAQLLRTLRRTPG